MGLNVTGYVYCKTNDPETKATVRYLIALGAIDDAVALLGWPQRDWLSAHAILVPARSLNTAEKKARKAGFMPQSLWPGYATSRGFRHTKFVMLLYVERANCSCNICLSRAARHA